MPLTSLLAGILLLILGVVGYTLSDAEHPVTALIPAGWGILLAICGGIAMAAPAARKHAMHAVAGVALLGLLLAGGRLIMVLMDDKPDTSLGVASLALMSAINGVVLVLCVRSFIAARRNRAQ